jgi:hypothetical protein
MFINNVINPMVSGFVSVPVSIENENYILEQNKTYVIVDSRVIRVTYIVKSNAQTLIRQNDFKVYVDLKDLETTNRLPIHVQTLNDVDSYISNVLPEPQYLHVELADVLRNEFTVGYEVVGDAGPGHSVGSVILSPNVVYVSGSNVAVDNIGEVKIDIPLGNNEETFSGIAKVKVYAKDGTLVPTEGLSLSAEEINYFVVINSRASVALNAVVEGNVKPGYTYAGAQVLPSSIMISGPRSVVQSQYVIDLPTINIDGLDANTEYTYNMSSILPKGITANVDNVRVNVVVNPNPGPMVPHHDRREGETSGNVISMPTTVSRDETETTTVDEDEVVVSSNKAIESGGITYATGSEVR